MKSKSMLLAGLTAGFSTLATGAMAQVAEGYSGHPHMWGHGSWGYGGHVFFPIIGIVVVVLVVMLVMRMMGCAGHRCGHRYGHSCGGGHGRGGSNAMAILEERFAKGEIDKADFEERKNALKD